MIVVRMIVAVTYSERDWDWSIWVWAVGPPLYLLASWMFAIHVRRRGTIRLRVLLPIALLPLVGFSIFIGTLTVVYFRETGGYPLTGWFAVDHLLWLVVSLLAPPYFLTTTWSTLRVLWNPSRSDDESADAHGAAVVGEFDVVNGSATICSGIAFFVDPKDPETLNAASPSSVTTQERMDLIINEVLRFLHAFLIDYPKARDVVRGRRLVVHMVELYADLRTDRVPPMDLGRDPIERALEQPEPPPETQGETEPLRL